MNDYDVIVIGGGAPGEHCIGALAEGGLRVALVERQLVSDSDMQRLQRHKVRSNAVPKREFGRVLDDLPAAHT